MTDQPSTPTNTSLARHIDFLFEVGSLRYAIRTWSQFLNPNCQNLTEHTLRVVWIALVLAKHEGITDTSKIIKMALVHDISESRSVDVNYVSRQYADRHEDKAISDTLGDTLLLDEFLPIWEEYEERQTLEAKIVKDADHLDVDLELRELEAMGNKLGQGLMPSRQEDHKYRFFTETARKMWQEIQKSDPHHWHLMARRG